MGLLAPALKGGVMNDPRLLFGSCRLSGTLRCGRAPGEGFSGDRPCTKWVSVTLINGSSSSPHPPLFNAPPPSCPPQVPHIREPLSSDHPRVSRHLLRVLRRLPRGPHTCTLFSGLSTEATGIQQKGSLPAGENVIFVLRCVCCHGNNNREAIRQH